MAAQLEIRDGADLTLAIGDARVRVSAHEGIELAERLTRASFRRLLVEEMRSQIPGFESLEEKCK